MLSHIILSGLQLTDKELSFPYPCFVYVLYLRRFRIINPAETFATLHLLKNRLKRN